MARSRVSFLWKDVHAAEGYQTGVSLRRHTSRSKETLDFIAKLAGESPLLGGLLRWEKERAKQKQGFEIDYKESYWTPPLTPRLAFDLERDQIESLLGLDARLDQRSRQHSGAPAVANGCQHAAHADLRRVDRAIRRGTRPSTSASTTCRAPPGRIGWAVLNASPPIPPIRS